jgi:hypothetical protein
MGACCHVHGVFGAMLFCVDYFGGSGWCASEIEWPSVSPAWRPAAAGKIRIARTVSRRGDIPTAAEYCQRERWSGQRMTREDNNLTDSRGRHRGAVNVLAEVPNLADEFVCTRTKLDMTRRSRARTTRRKQKRKHPDLRSAEARDAGTNDGRIVARDRVADASNGGGDGFARCCWLQLRLASLGRGRDRPRLASFRALLSPWIGSRPYPLTRHTTI